MKPGRKQTKIPAAMAKKIADTLTQISIEATICSTKRGIVEVRMFELSCVAEWLNGNDRGPENTDIVTRKNHSLTAIFTAHCRHLGKAPPSNELLAFMEEHGPA